MAFVDETRPRVLHVITGLGTGGAEAMLVKLTDSLANNTDAMIISLMGNSNNVIRIGGAGTPLVTLGMKPGGFPSFFVLKNLLRVTYNFRPDIIQGWMYHGNVAAWLISLLACRRAKLLWNIRQTLYDLSFEKPLTRWVIVLSRWLSYKPLKIIYNSQLSANQHEAMGYPHRSCVVIPNGFELNQFKPNLEARECVKNELRLAPGIRLVVHVARYHPMKDHRTLLMAARMVSQEYSSTKFLLVGLGVCEENEELKSLCQQLGLRNTVLLLGERPDIPRLLAAADLLVLSSAWGEGFPNVVGEAMACGTPCVVTDVGDSASVLGDCGYIVPPRNPEALAVAMERLLANSRQLHDLSAKARRRVVELYSIEQISKRYLDLYRGSLI